jgi:hypothetical protein
MQAGAAVVVSPRVVTVETGALESGAAVVAATVETAAVAGTEVAPDAAGSVVGVGTQVLEPLTKVKPV